MNRDTVPPTAESLESSTQRLKSSLDKIESKPPVSMLLASTLVYLAGPYTAATREGVELNIARAVDRAVEVAKLGAMPVCPHSNTGDERFEKAQDYRFWVAGTMELLRRSDALLTIDGWQSSSGARGEVTAADRMGKPVFHSVDHLARWLENRKREILEA